MEAVISCSFHGGRRFEDLEGWRGVLVGVEC